MKSNFLSLARRRAALDEKTRLISAVLKPGAALIADDACPQTVVVVRSSSARPLLIVSARAEARRVGTAFLYTGCFTEVEADFRAPGFSPCGMTRNDLALLMRASLDEERRLLEEMAARRAAQARKRRARSSSAMTKEKAKEASHEYF